MEKGWSGVAVAVLALCLVGCASKPARPRTPPEPPKHPMTAMLIPYAAPDGTLTRAQMEAGLHRDFTKADVNHNGCLDDKEVRAINQQRWTQDASTASPLIDFKQNGCFDFDEYAATARSLFDQLDREGTGKLTAQQLKPGSKPDPSSQPAQPAAPAGDGHHRGGSPSGG
jgi:hypothetical protein